MKKQCVTFGLGVIVGAMATFFMVIMCIVIMRGNLFPKDVEESMTDSQTAESHESATSNEETVKIPDDAKEDCSLDYEAADTDAAKSDVMQSQESESIQLKDENGEFTPDALALAEEYLSKFENEEWDGYSVMDSGIEVGEFWGMITLNSEETQIRSDKRMICDEAIESYMSGEWDGTEKELSNGHTVKLKEGGGYLLLDGYIALGQKNLDLPEYAYDLIYDNICNYEYVPGEGTYTIIDSKLVKFLRGKQVDLPGYKLSWKGFKSPDDINAKVDSDSYILYDAPKLIYNKIDGKLYLTTGDKTCTLDNSVNYLYVFDYCNKSEMRYIGKVDFEHEYPGDIDMSKVKFVKK